MQNKPVFLLTLPILIFKIYPKVFVAILGQELFEVSPLSCITCMKVI